MLKILKETTDANKKPLFLSVGQVMYVLDFIHFHYFSRPGNTQF